MGAVGASLTVSGDGDREGLHAAIWDAVRDLIGMYTGSSAYGAVTEYLGDAISVGADDGIWSVDGDSLRWTFKDFAGCCSRSAHAWSHWLALALAVEWDRIQALAEQHALAITSARPSVEAALVGGVHYVTLRDDLWSVDADRLYGDDETVEVTALDPEERIRHARALERCLCGPCTMVRPEPEIEANLREALGDPETASSAAWYLSRMHRTSAETLVALVRAGHLSLRPMVPMVERYARRFPATWSTLVEVLPTLTGGARGLAFYALSETRRDEADRETLLRELRAALAGNDGAAESAAELIGFIGRGTGELADHLAAVLDRSDASAELRHNVVLGLVNLHLPDVAPTPANRARIEREATRDSEAGRLAAWMLKSF